MDKVFREGDLMPKGPGTCVPPSGAAPGLHPIASEGLGLRPIRHKEFNEFIKGKGFKG